jgi:hypothetical protein
VRDVISTLCGFQRSCSGCYIILEVQSSGASLAEVETAQTYYEVGCTSSLPIRDLGSSSQVPCASEAQATGMTYLCTVFCYATVDQQHLQQ